jgi:thiosulfate dehydrogenase [quinone] large subunit
VLSVMLFLTISFHSAPYYTGADIVFAFAWTPLLLAGSGSVLSLDAAVKDWAGRQAAAARRLERRSGPAAPEVHRREVLLRGTTTAAVAAVSLVIGGLAAGLGRLVGGTAGKAGPSSLPSAAGPVPTATARPSSSSGPSQARFLPARPSAQRRTCPSARPPRSRIRPRVIRRS